MTTKVIVEARHGWPVLVTPLDPKTGAVKLSDQQVVAPGADGVFYIHDGQDLRIHEVQPAEVEPVSSAPLSSPIIRHFAYAHLPPALQEVSKPIGDLALQMDQALPDGPEKSAGLRKLLEAKDCLVRAKIG